MSSSALRWSFAQQLARQFFSIAIYLALAKLLSPVDFGLVGIAAIWISIGTLFIDSGFSTALIQKKDVSDRHLNSVFVLNVVFGVTMFALIYFSAPLLSASYGEPALTDILRVMAISILFTAVASTKVSLAQKTLEFRLLTFRDIIAVTIGGSVGLIAAFSELSVWSLVFQAVVTSIVLFVVTWNIVDWKPSISNISLNSIRDLWGYSSKIFTFGLLKFVSQNIDLILIGFLLGPSAVGLYGFASKTVITPISSIRAAFGAYLFPRFSIIQDRPDVLVAEYTHAIKRVGYLVTPILLVAYFFVEEAVLLVFGSKWIGAIPLIKVIAFVALMQSLIAPIGELIKAIGRPELLVWWGIGFTFASVVFIYLGTEWQLMGVALALGLVHLGGVLACILISSSLLNVGLPVMVRAYIIPLSMFVALVLLGNLIGPIFNSLVPFASLMTLCVLLALNVVLLRVFDPVFFKGLRFSGRTDRND